MANNDLAMTIYRNVYRALHALESISKESREYADQYDKIIDFFKLINSTKSDPEKLKKVLDGLKKSVLVLDHAAQHSLESNIKLYVNDLRTELSELKDIVDTINSKEQLELDFDNVELDKLKEKN